MPMRRSPRHHFAPKDDQTLKLQTSTERKKMKNSRVAEMALELHANHETKNEEDLSPVPLQMYHLHSSAGTKMIRRSSRLCISEAKCCPAQNETPIMCSHAENSSRRKISRRSPRFSTTPGGNRKRSWDGLRNLGGRRKQVLLLCSSKNLSLRRSPRLMAESVGVKSSEHRTKMLEQSDFSSEKRSCELIGTCLGECDSAILKQKCSRSHKVFACPLDPPTVRKRKLNSSGTSGFEEKMQGIKKMNTSLPNGCLVEKVDAKLQNQNRSLRKSPRFSTPTKCESSSLESDVQMQEAKCTSHPARFSSSSAENEDDAGVESVPLALPRPLQDGPCIITSSGSSARVSEERVLRRSPRTLSSPAKNDNEDEDELPKPKKKKPVKKKDVPDSCDNTKKAKLRSKSFFVGEPIPDEEARERWGWRYKFKSRSKDHRSTLNVDDEDEDEVILDVKCHYAQAEANKHNFDLGDCAYIRGEQGSKLIGRIIEFFQTTKEQDYFRVQWFYKAQDTVMKEAASSHDKKRVFYSSLMNDNLLDCIISKVNIVQIAPLEDLNSSPILLADFYYDMEYCLDYSTFQNLPKDTHMKNHILYSPKCFGAIVTISNSTNLEVKPISKPYSTVLSLLDLYSGCGAMSTGLCVGAKLSGVNIMTRWAVDSDCFACESLRLNHPETYVRNEVAEDFLELLKHWQKLCMKYAVQEKETPKYVIEDLAHAANDANIDYGEIPADELEVSKLLDICYGDPDKSGSRGLKFKVRWKGYGPSDDSWEPIEGLSNCEETIQDFVMSGLKNKILPLPGDVAVICGGPPCQGISGYNRFRSIDAPLDDDRNCQILVFMDIIKFLKPKYILMENVLDILKFDKGSLGRLALSHLVRMNYQARVGVMAAGCYGLPQFRMRVFFWGALPSEELPQFPLPTHDVVVRYWPPLEFERNVVAYDLGQVDELEDAVFLRDAISDLPAVTNDESSDEMPYGKPPETEFQRHIRSSENEWYPPLKVAGSASCNKKTGDVESVLYDHRPHKLFEDDFVRVCHIPHRKGANFRVLPGVIVGDDNVARRDPTKDPVLLPSGKPIVPEYALNFEKGKSKRPFARLWWDETLPTIVTYPDCHSQAILHPEQDRVLTVRECARLQGFPDHYRFCGTVKKRYRQIGNAVPIPVARALGYALGMASQKLTGKEPLMKLPPKFSYLDSFR